MIWAGIAARWLLGRLQGLWRVIAAHPWPFIVAALLGLSWALLQRGNRYRDDLVATLEAQQQAEQAQIAANREPARKSEEIARKSNDQAPAYHAAVRRAADAAIVRAKACPVGAPDLPGADQALEGLHGPYSTSDLVSVAKPDYDQLTYAAGRAAQMHQEALDLIAGGAASGD